MRWIGKGNAVKGIKVAIGLVGAFLALGDALAAPRLAFQVHAVRDLEAKDFVGTLKAAKPTDSPSSLDGLRNSHALLSEFSAQAFVVAERGRPAACTVVRADDAGPSVIRAADEFADYTERMTGVRLPVASRADGAAVRIVRDDSFGDDGFRLTSDWTGVTVRGGVRGCLYGVYELLETYGGVGWFASWRTVVPKTDRFALPDGLDVTERPAFKMRMTSWLDAQNGDFASRLRLNGFVNRLEARHGGEACRFGRRMGSCHTFAHLLPARKYFKDHPEYFAMRGGKRTLDERLAPWGYTQPCLTNPDVLRIVTSNVLEAIRADPAAGLYGVSQNDNQQYCECPACAAVDAGEGSHAGTVVRFVNAVAAEVERHYPDAVIETLAYQYSRTPPKKTRLRRNVMPCLCSIECDFHKPLTESAYAQNRRFVEDIRGWREQTDMLYLWDYTTNFRHYLHAFPNIMALQGNLRFYRDNRVKYMFEQGDSKGLHADFAELRTWLLAKWMWNPDRPAGPLLDRFFAGYYGAAAPMARRYFDGLYALPRDSEKQHLGIYESVLSTNMPTAFFERGEALWREALAAVMDDPQCRTNVEMAALSVAYTLYQRLPRPRSVWVTRHPERFADDSRRKELAARLLTAYGPHRLRFAESTKSNDRELEEMRAALSFAAPTAECDRVEVPAEGLTLVLPGKYGEYAADPKASHGRAIRLFNTHYEWCVRLPMRTVAYDEGATYRLRVRVRVEKDPDAKGEAFWTGVYDPEAKRDVLHVTVKVQNCGSDYVWCDLGKWIPRDCQSFWLGPGRFKKDGGKSAVRAVWVDCIELQEEKKE